MQATIRRGIGVVLISIIGFLIWAAFIPLDSGVLSKGIVSVDGRRKVVQHQRGGVINHVLVQEGDSVRQGDTLIELESSLERANKSQIFSQLSATQLQLASLGMILPGLRELAEDGFYPRNQVVDLERRFLESQALEKGLKDQLAAAEKELQRTVILAPADGRVMGLGVNTAGAVIIAGAKLMDIVPYDVRVTIEAQVRPHLIDKVFTGAAAQIRFSALESSRTPVIAGRIEWISADRFLDRGDSLNPEGFYLAKISITADELAKASGLRVMPGMPADVIIKTGERTFFDYVVKPISDRLASAVKEL